MKFVPLVMILLVTSPVGHAQQTARDWDWKVAPYLWTLAGDGRSGIGPLQSGIDFDFGDIISNLDFAGLLYVSAERGHHGFHGDFQYLVMEPDPSPAPIGPGVIDTELELTTIEGAYHYRFGGTEYGGSLLFGARYIDSTVTLTPSVAARRRAEVDWVDGFAGFQYGANLSTNWESQFQVTAGAGGADLTLTGQFVITRKLPSGNNLALGARIWDIDYDDTVGGNVPFELNLTFYGLMVGYIFD